MTRPPAVRPLLWMLCSAFAFATMGALTFALGSRCHWLLVALVRCVVMFALACVIVRVRGARFAVLTPRTLWVRSLAGSFSLVCNFYALTRLPVADVLTLTNTYPLWIIALTAVMLKAPPTLAEILGVASGLAGVVLIQQPHHIGGDGLAAAVALVSSVSTAVAMLGLHRLRAIEPAAIVAHFAGVASLVAGGWLLLERADLGPHAGEPLTWALLGGVALSGTVGQFFLTKAYAAGAPTEVSVAALSQVVFAMGFDMAIWGRALTPVALIGFALVLGPTVWLTGRAGRRLARSAGATASHPIAAAPTTVSTPEVEPKTVPAHSAA